VAQPLGHMNDRARTILSGVDGSEHSVRAAKVAHALSRALDIDLVLAHVSPGGVRPLPVPHPVAAASDVELESDLAVIADTAGRAGLTGVRTRRVAAGSPTAGLVATARVELAYLIVIGASGHSVLREALLGSVAGELPLKAPCPVVVTPPDVVMPDAMSPAEDDKSIVCGVADSAETQAVARTAGELARALEARLVLVHARLPQPPVGSATMGRHSLAIADHVVAEREERISADLLGRATEWSACEGAGLETVIETGDPAERIEAVAEREPADLIVVGSRGRGPLRAAVLGSTSRRLAASARRPVVIVGPHAQG
jgi:nucleotide-binding universal stress UspA family protein